MHEQNLASSARFVDSTLTRGSPNSPRSRPSTWPRITSSMRSGAIWRARNARHLPQRRDR
jgi:hypothetical protein